MLRFRKSDRNEYPDWEEQLLSDLVAHYGGTALESFVSKDGKCNFISIGNYSPDGKYIDNGQRINPIGKAAEKRLKKNDLVMVLNDKTAAGTIIGSTILIDSDNYIYNQRSERMVCNESVFPTFMWYYINSPVIKNKILKMKQGATQIYVNFVSVYNMKTNIPCLEEQQKIADFLSKMDEKISNQEAVVSDYEELKKGLMQKIFSQEIRFKADDGSEYPEWEEKTFMEVFNVIQNNTFSRDCLNKNEGEVLNIHYGDVLIKYGSITDICKEEIPFINIDILLDKFTKESYLCNGDIVISDTAEDMTVGKATEIYGVAEKKVLSGLHTIPCRPKMTFAPRYLGYYINSEEYHNQLIPLIQGIKVSSISKGNISKTIITYPCLEEQQKIADCLSAMDKKIEAEKKILEDWKELKKALLQQMFV